jgi:EpsD family peptidyl-prolyl cis-trans isomerase
MRAGVWGAALAAVIVAGCGQGAPGKDVAAVVGGETITVAELDRELANAGMSKVDARLRRQALEEIVVRKLLAKAARSEGLTKTPVALEAKRAADEAFDANLDRIATVAKTPPPTPAEVKAYIAARPEMFERRTGYLIEQLQVPQRHTPDLFEALRPTKTLEEAEAIFKARRIPYRRVILPMDTLRTDPRLSAAVAKLPPGEPFVLPGVSSFTVNRIRGSQVKPVTGVQAEAVAKELIRAERVNKALRDRLQALHQEQVTYGPDFQPKAVAAAPAKK